MLKFYEGKKVVVTGASGLIGSYAVKILKESGANVKAIVHTRKSNEFTELADDIVTLDLTNTTDSREAVSGCEIVFDGAGTTGGVAFAKSNPMDTVTPNVLTTVHLFDACVKEGAKRIGILSSTTTYPFYNYPVKEEEADSGPPWPSYVKMSTSKRFLEKMARFYFESCNLGAAIVRPTMAYGRYDNFKATEGHFIPSLIVKALESKPDEPLVLWGTGDEVRDVMHAQDAAIGLLLGIEKLPDASPVNLGTGRSTTIRGVLETILNLLGKKTRVICDATKPSAIPYRMVDLTKAKTLLGFDAAVSLEEGLRDTIEWYRTTLG